MLIRHISARAASPFTHSLSLRPRCLIDVEKNRGPQMSLLFLCVSPRALSLYPPSGAEKCAVSTIYFVQHEPAFYVQYLNEGWLSHKSSPWASRSNSSRVKHSLRLFSWTNACLSDKVTSAPQRAIAAQIPWPRT